MTWRDRLRPIIHAVLTEHSAANDKVLQNALREAWRKLFGAGHTKGSGCSWQYQVWRDEIAKQREKLARIDGRVIPMPTGKIRRRKIRTMTAEQVREWFDKHQLRMFDQ